MRCFRYDEQRSSLHAEGLINGSDIPLINIWNAPRKGDQPSGICSKDHMGQNHRSIHTDIEWVAEYCGNECRNKFALPFININCLQPNHTLKMTTLSLHKCCLASLHWQYPLSLFCFISYLINNVNYSLYHLLPLFHITYLVHPTFHPCTTQKAERKIFL
jgi:hypothetical protein